METTETFKKGQKVLVSNYGVTFHRAIFITEYKGQFICESENVLQVDTFKYCKTR